MRLFSGIRLTADPSLRCRQLLRKSTWQDRAVAKHGHHARVSGFVRWLGFWVHPWLGAVADLSWQEANFHCFYHRVLELALWTPPEVHTQAP